MSRAPTSLGTSACCRRSPKVRPIWTCISGSCRARSRTPTRYAGKLRPSCPGWPQPRDAVAAGMATYLRPLATHPTEDVRAASRRSDRESTGSPVDDRSEVYPEVFAAVWGCARKVVRYACRDDVRCAGRIVSVVERQRTGLDDHDARTGMRGSLVMTDVSKHTKEESDVDSDSSLVCPSSEEAAVARVRLWPKGR
jgi:hypothetical protein